jgi:hypothetical protein
LNTETGEIARVTATGITNLSDVSAIANPPPEIKALLDMYASKPTTEKATSELKPGESTTEGLLPGWSVKRDN